jgi:hypothetical protein
MKEVLRLKKIANWALLCSLIWLCNKKGISLKQLRVSLTPLCCYLIIMTDDNCIESDN